jgi:hypothetical protein
VDDGKWLMSLMSTSPMLPLSIFPALLGDKSASTQIRANHELLPSHGSRDRYIAIMYSPTRDL